ncbi:hypothetical protein [Jatrophihabitans sp. GAS493]|nr:hypothetical protein [Jatrophihabitans sp. GAS493]
MGDRDCRRRCSGGPGRPLLATAAARDLEAAQLQDELSAVI